MGEEGMGELPWEATFVENVIRARLRLGMSQTELAKRVTEGGVKFHQQTVQRIESGTRPVRMNEAMVICHVLTMTLTDALTPKDPRGARIRLLGTIYDVYMRIVGGEYRDQVDILLQRLEADIDTLEQDTDNYLEATPDDESSKAWREGDILGSDLALEVLNRMHTSAGAMRTEISRTLHPSRSQTFNNLAGDLGELLTGSTSSFAKGDDDGLDR